MNNKTEAKRLAFFLYCNILGHNLTRPYVVPRDLEAFFDSTEEVRSYAGGGRGHGGLGPWGGFCAWELQCPG